jgi:tetratricopeptide (TPR) repeat protein
MVQQFYDARGVPVTADNRQAADAYTNCIESFLALDASTGALLDEVFDADPDMAMAHVLKGFFYMLFAVRPLMAKARGALARARQSLERRGGTAREHAFASALDAWSQNQTEAAAKALLAVLEDYPRDIQAIKHIENWSFYRGRSQALLRLQEGIGPAWDKAVPGYGFVLGMRAFAFEETGHMAEARTAAREAIALNPADIWAAHAGAHVFETQGRFDDGKAWLDDLSEHWKTKGNFAFHAWWHRALFAFDLGDYDEVLALYDTRIRPEPSRDFRDIANATSLLWRLELEQVDVGERWRELAANVRERAGEGVLPFAEAHFAFALASAGDFDALERQAARLSEMAGLAETPGPVTAEILAPLIGAITGFAKGAYDAAADDLLQLQGGLAGIGGSHAQRDVFERTLAAALWRAGRIGEARDILAKRLKRRPGEYGTQHNLSQLSI